MKQHEPSGRMVSLLAAGIVVAAVLSGCVAAQDVTDRIRYPRAAVPNVAPKTFGDFNWPCASRMASNNWGTDPLLALGAKADCDANKNKYDNAFSRCASQTGYMKRMERESGNENIVKAFDQCMIPILYADAIRQAERQEARRAARAARNQNNP